MKKLAVAVTIAFALVACDDNDSPNGPSDGPIVFNVQMSAAQEVPPVTGPEAGATGTATITFDVPRDSAGNVTGGGTATFSVQMSNFPNGTAIRAAHIHPGAAGATGSIFVDTTLTPGDALTLANGSGNFTRTQNNLSQDQATQIVANPAGFYFNVHSALNPGGAIRGQLVRQQ